MSGLGEARREALDKALVEGYLAAGETESLFACQADALVPLISGWLAVERAGVDDERAARMVAADSADRFRDVLSDALGHEDENPGDDVLVADLRRHFGRTGPEPTRWRDFITGAQATVDQINADRAYRGDT